MKVIPDTCHAHLFKYQRFYLDSYVLNLNLNFGV